MDREPKTIITDGALGRLREFTGTSMAHLPDQHLRLTLDEAILKANDDQVEEWWERDRSYGICHNTVIRVDGKFEGANCKFYAVLRVAHRPNFVGQKICIAVVNEAHRKIAIRDNRWLPEEPEEPEPGSLEYKALANVRDHVKAPMAHARQEPEDPKAFMVRIRGEEHHFDSEEEAKGLVMESLLMKGVPITEIRVYSHIPIEFDLSLGGGKK